MTSLTIKSKYNPYWISQTQPQITPKPRDITFVRPELPKGPQSCLHPAPRSAKHRALHRRGLGFRGEKSFEVRRLDRKI